MSVKRLQQWKKNGGDIWWPLLVPVVDDVNDELLSAEEPIADDVTNGLVPTEEPVEDNITGGLVTTEEPVEDDVTNGLVSFEALVQDGAELIITGWMTLITAPIPAWLKHP